MSNQALTRPKSARILSFPSQSLPEHQLQSIVTRNLRKKRPRSLNDLETIMLVEHVVSRLAEPGHMNPTMTLILQAALGYLTLARKVCQLPKDGE